MPSSIRRSFQETGGEKYLFGLSLSEPKVKFRRNGTFRLVSRNPSNSRFSWVSLDDGSRGKVRASHLARKQRWKDYTTDENGRGAAYQSAVGLDSANGGSDHKVMATMPNGKGGNLFMFEMDRPRYKGSRQVIEGRVLSKDFMLDHHDEITRSFGQQTFHGHLDFVDHYQEILDNLASVRQGSSRRSERLSGEVPSVDGGRRSYFFSSIGGAIESAVNDAADVVTDATNVVVTETVEVVTEAAEVVVDAGKEAAEAVEGAAEDVAEAVEAGYEIIVTTAEDIAQYTEMVADWTVKYAKKGYEIVTDLLTGSEEFPFSVVWPEVGLDFNDSPFQSRLAAQVSMDGNVRFRSGIVTAIWDPSTISFTAVPRITLSGDVGLDLGSVGTQYSKTFSGPTITTAAPVIGQATLSSAIDVTARIGAQLGEDVGRAAVGMTVAPAASFTMSNRGLNFADKSSSPELTPMFGHFTPDSLAPSSGMTLTVTPRMSFLAGPTLPGLPGFPDPFRVATFDVTVANPVPFTFDLANPSQLEVATSANATSQFTFMEGTVTPQLMNEPLYRPVVTTVDL